MTTVHKCLFGQILAMVLGISISFQDKITEKDPPPFYFIFIFVHLTILIFSSIRLMMSKNILRKRPKLYIYVLPCILDFFGGITLNKSFSGSTDYLVALITQFIYPMSVVTELLVYKKHSFNIKKMGAFLALCLVCFVVNMLQDTKPLSCTIISIIFALVSNCCYMSVVFLEADILPDIDANLFMRDFSLLGILVGLLYTVTVEYSKLNIGMVLEFYKSSAFNIILYAVPLSLFYICAPRFINSFGGSAYNASIITESVYIGFLHMIRDGKFNIYVILGFSVCIVASVFLVAMEQKRTKSNP